MLRLSSKNWLLLERCQNNYQPHTCLASLRKKLSSSTSGSGPDEGGSPPGSKDPKVESKEIITKKPSNLKTVGLSDKGKPELQVNAAEYMLSHPDPSKQSLAKKLFEKPYESTYVANRPIQNPLERAFDIMKPRKMQKTKFYKDGFDAYYDICIIGGGVMGCSVAYWLANRFTTSKPKICVVEKDPTVINPSSCSRPPII